MSKQLLGIRRAWSTKYRIRLAMKQQKNLFLREKCSSLTFTTCIPGQYADLVIVIDERSADDSGGLAKSLSAMVMRHTRNKGKGFALKTGLIESLNHNPDVIVTIDADGQHDPSEIPRLVGPILWGKCDIVVGSTSRIQEW